VDPRVRVWVAPNGGRCGAAGKSNAKPRFEIADGNTVTFGEQFVRLVGADSPEYDHACANGRPAGEGTTKAPLPVIAGTRPIAKDQLQWPSARSTASRYTPNMVCSGMAPMYSP
jgi:hypothetical protein